MGRRTRLALTIVAVLAGLLVASELVLRANDHSVLARIKAQTNVRDEAYRPDPDVGAVLNPSQTTRIVTPEFTYTLRTDHAGFTNSDPWPARLDVAVFGNSLITGSGVGHEGQFTTLLGQELGGRSVLNFGIHGGGTGTQLRAYRKFAAALHPKLVISTLWLVWEIDNSLKFEDWLDTSPRPDFTAYRLAYGDGDNGSGTGHPSPVGRGMDFLHRLAGGSRLLRAAHDWIRSLRGIPEPDEEVVLDSGDVMLLSKRNAERLLQGWERPGTRDVRATFYAPLETLRQEVEADGGTFLVALFPSKEELYGARDLPELLNVVEDARVQLAARGIATVDLYSLLESHATPPPFFRVDMHPNPAGNRLVAHALAQWATERHVFQPAADGGAVAAD